MRNLILGLTSALLLTVAAPSDAASGGQKTGVMTSMTVLRNGTVSEIYVKIAGSARTERVSGCGMKSADHPLLNSYFEKKRLVYIYTDAKGCFQNVGIKS